ncbi:MULTISPECIES: GH12 family glycosyl hydrolase domain-containing protein [Nonomuraea]|uniref:Cellulose binding domain-containing protein n=1 Tax=Nonomuraea ferruginea TaxID=46174 RepID=A0ABT4TDK8_9ACTN|nr:cellulose binding domain-containing protein [Nonomuraea ferruginea]MDA0647631.1 cellulose binding domain-containing protein [Nonomuraea ferruginea]
MRRVHIPLALAVLLAAFAFAMPAHAAPVICEKYGSAQIQNGRYIVQNNVWGASTAQCIDVNQNGGFTVTQAAHNNATNGAPAAYPSIYAGCHYAACTTGSGLPVRADASGFGNLRSSVSMSYPGSGTWNAAYDLWFDPTPRTDGQNTGAELMIWLNHRGSIQPIGSRVGTANLAGGTWDVWFGNVGWNVISYVRTSPASSIDFAVDTFFSDVVARGYGQRSWYLTSVQAGFEPWVGGAGLAVNSFAVTTSGGQDPQPGGSCQATATTQGQWATGYVVQPVTVVNRGSSPISGWRVTFTLPAGHAITGSWGAQFSTSGQTVTVTNFPYNGSLAPGASTTFGFQASKPSGSSALPSGYTCA